MGKIALDKYCKLVYVITTMKNINVNTEYLNLTKAARYLDVAYMTIWRWKRIGKLKVTYIGGTPFVLLTDLDILKEGNNDGPTTKKNS